MCLRNQHIVYVDASVGVRSCYIGGGATTIEVTYKSSFVNLAT